MPKQLLVNKEVRLYLAKIGRRGGKAGKGVKKTISPMMAHMKATRAANLRWHRPPEQPAQPETVQNEAGDTTATVGISDTQPQV